MKRAIPFCPGARQVRSMLPRGYPHCASYIESLRFRFILAYTFEKNTSNHSISEQKYTLSIYLYVISEFFQSLRLLSNYKYSQRADCFSY